MEAQKMISYFRLAVFVLGVEIVPNFPVLDFGRKSKRIPKQERVLQKDANAPILRGNGRES